MKALSGVVLAFGLVGTAWAAGDDEAKAPKSVMDDDSYFNLLDRLRKLEEKLEGTQQDEELEKLKKMAAQERQQEMSELPARVSKVEKGQAVDDDLHAFKKWLEFKSPDGNFTAKVGGRLYVVYRYIAEADDTAPSASTSEDAFVLDTARIQLDGTFFKDFFYRAEMSSDRGGSVSPNDVYLGWSGLKSYFTLQGGQFKVPFSQEETTSSRFIDFAERSLLNRLVPGRDVGLMVSGEVGEGIFQWYLGVFNGTGKNLADNNDEKDVAGRVWLTPLKNTDMKILKQFRLGFDFTVGDQDGGYAFSDVHTGDIGSVTFIDHNVNTYGDGLRTRYDIGVSWIYGPMSLRGEYFMAKFDLRDAAPQSDYEIRAYNVQGTFLLTGEDKALENRVKPKNNLNPMEGGWGAWELAARYCFVDASDGEDAGVITIAPATGPETPQKISQVTAGINWWWTSNMCLRLNWEHLMYGDDIANLKSDNEADDTQDIFYVRWQIDF
jgi:phosphate-selective porin OprO/OprP